MAWFLFVDESGQDGTEAHYEVLAGVAVEDRAVWNLILAMREAEELYFGMRISHGELELKGKDLLKRKTFRLADQLPSLPPAERKDLARACLEKGYRAHLSEQDRAPVTRRELTALGQAKLAFVEHLLELAGRYGVRTFASIVDRDAPRPAGTLLRKDYAYLFERYFYFLEDQPGDVRGLVVFDEIERSQCHILVDQMSQYVRGTAKGRWRAGRVIPEPFFVHSELTTLIQLADIVAYVVSWGVRFSGMKRPRREELEPFSTGVCRLRHRAVRERLGEPFSIWSFSTIDDLRPRDERAPEEQ